VQIRELGIAGAFEVSPIIRKDDRGSFLEWYRHDLLEAALGHSLHLRQANTSISARGVLRGIHFADIPKGQAKYVTVPSGAILDFVVDIRVGSPTFGKWEAVRLDSTDFRALYIAEGLGHAFVALTENATVSYLVSDTYRADREHGINPLDPRIGLEFPTEIINLVLSPKDLEAPSLAEAEADGQLPTWQQALDFYRSLDRKEV
jgi:dTDP-4-dehydrorhamnose 3,5-epimerase